jgi:hypothetical protein
LHRKIDSKCQKLSCLAKKLPESQNLRELTIKVSKQIRELRFEINKRTDEQNIALRRASLLKNKNL